MIIVKRIKNAYVRYDETFDMFMISEIVKNETLPIGNIDKNHHKTALMCGEYTNIQHVDQKTNLMKMNKGIFYIQFGHLCFSGSITLYQG